MHAKTFKENVLNSLCECAVKYNKLSSFSYQIKSDKFVYREAYTIRFHKGNFLHLTGVKTALSPNDFYEKCISKTLEFNDFDCDSTKSLKGTVRQKIKNLITIDSFFENSVAVQEKFERGRVSCLIASSNGKCTIGFIGGKNLNPMTLLNKNQINPKMQITDFEISKERNFNHEK